MEAGTITIRTELHVDFVSPRPEDTRGMSSPLVPNVLLRCSPRHNSSPWRDFVGVDYTHPDGRKSRGIARLWAVLPVVRREGQQNEEEEIFLALQPFYPLNYRDVRVAGPEGMFPPLTSLPWVLHASAITREGMELAIVEAGVFQETVYTFPGINPTSSGDLDREYVFWVDKELYFPVSCAIPRPVV